MNQELKLTSENDLGEHDWKDNGVDIHKGEYWYKCSKCGASDWIASYGNKNQLMPQKCNPTKKIKGTK